MGTGATESASTDGGGPPPLCEGGGWNGVGEDGAGDTGFGMGDDMPLPFSVYEIQQGNAPADVRIVLTDVVVTTPAAAGEALWGQELFVQEREGGPYSGLRIHTSAFDLGAALAVGDTADIVGEIRRQDDYYLLDLGSRDDLTRTGTAALPEPVVVTTSTLRPEDPMARPYEGVTVRVESPRVTDDDPCRGEFVLDDVVRVDDRFMPDALTTPARGQTLASVEGVLVYASDSYELAPPDPSAIR